MISVNSCYSGDLVATSKEKFHRRIMNEQQAKSVADALGGYAWNSGGEIWLVRLERSDGKLVVISDEVICEYASEEAFDKAAAQSAILLH